MPIKQDRRAGALFGRLSPRGLKLTLASDTGYARWSTRTLDPPIKSQQITLIYQADFDISSVRSRIEPERKLENVETKPSGPAVAVAHCPVRPSSPQNACAHIDNADVRSDR